MVLISDKVVKFTAERNFLGIALKKEINKFGWAGCVDVIRGEFIKNKIDLDSKIQYTVEEYKGVKVFIPESLKNSISSSQEIRIRSNLSFFGVMILSVDIFEK